MEDLPREELRLFAETLVRTAGDMTRRACGRDGVRYKESDVAFDVFTETDEAVNTFIQSEIARAFPAHGIHSEEGGITTDRSLVWTIDPIDGSSNFSRGIPHFGVCVGLMRGDTPLLGALYNPMTTELFSFDDEGVFLNGSSYSINTQAPDTLSGSTIALTVGSRKENWEWGLSLYRSLLSEGARVRNFGASALDIAYLALGRFDAVVYGGLSLRDISPVIGMLRKMGGEIYLFETGEVAPLSASPARVVATRNRQLAESLRTLSRLSN